MSLPDQVAPLLEAAGYRTDRQVEKYGVVDFTSNTVHISFRVEKDRPGVWILAVWKARIPGQDFEEWPPHLEAAEVTTAAQTIMFLVAAGLVEGVELASLGTP